MRQTQFLAPILLESPSMFEILEKIRDKYGIDKLDPSKDPYKQRIAQDMEQNPPIDWQAVQQQPYPPFGHPPQMLCSTIAAPAMPDARGVTAPTLLIGIWGGKG
jgi:hypothetical protein